MKKPDDPRQQQIIDRYWDSIRNLPAIEALYATAVRAWLHARHCTDDPELVMMLLRPAAYLAIRREDIKPHDAHANLVETMMRLDRLATAQEQRQAQGGKRQPMRRTRWSDTHVIDFAARVAQKTNKKKPGLE